MMLPIPPGTTLTGTQIQLVPLEASHIPDLELLAATPAIWQFYVFDGADTALFRAAMQEALVAKAQGTQFPFVILHRPSGKIIGSTRFLDIQPQHHKLEIGWTWLHPDYWATGCNRECKQLLLTYCFEQLKAVRVQFKTDELNLRSRRAIEKLGARFEGILRNDMLRHNGTRRHSAYYSILEEEWGGLQALFP